MKESLTSSNNNSNNSNNSNNNNRSSNGVKEDAASNDNSGSGTKTVVKVERLGSSMNKGVRLTSLHIECLKQCILAHRRLLHLAVAEKVLSYKFDSLSGLVDSTSKAFMQYHYYAGMVYVGLDEMEKAVNTWQLVFAIPSKHLSSIQVATYKKILLAHVVASNGKKYQLPGFYSSVLLRELESLASSYISLSEALATASSYSSGSSPTDRVIKRVDEMRDTLMRDQNQGYVGKILRDLPAIQIKNISKAYSTIRVSQLVELIGYSANVFLRGNDNPSASLIAYIQQMDDPSIHVQQQGDEIGSAMVAFVPVKSTISQLPNQGPSGDTEARINIESMWVDAVKQKFEETELLKARLSQLDKHLALTREYVTNSRDSSGNV
ncbi:hypothetical protein GGI12_002449 [Dipsacomyces acuminosporus]|nr:hypothetical protein GGI12_002449 [Dipsacomyces acuminosporus]